MSTAIRSRSQARLPALTSAALMRTVVIGLTAFLTVVDLFATQAILPSLARAFDAPPAAVGFAVNACTIGMAIGGLVVALCSRWIDRRRGIVTSLVLLALPTALLAMAPDLATFTGLRIVQGVFMAAAFALTLAHLAEACSAADATTALAAYVTGNVASNLFGRMMSAAFADHLGLATNFYLFALLNLAGAVLVSATLHRTRPAVPEPATVPSPLAVWKAQLACGPLRSGFGIGFCILFAFIGTFTYVNFVLVAPPFALTPMALGLVYLVFLPSIVTTPLAGRVARRLGAARTVQLSLALAAGGLPLLLTGSLSAVLAGLILVGVGTFFAQATAAAFVGQAAVGDRASASGLYLAAYFLGGMVGSAVLGQVFDRLGWTACVFAILLALALGGVLAARLQRPAPASAGSPGAALPSLAQPAGP
jgi:YNFM family putative membrane transporter